MGNLSAGASLTPTTDTSAYNVDAAREDVQAGTESDVEGQEGAELEGDALAVDGEDGDPFAELAAQAESDVSGDDGLADDPFAAGDTESAYGEADTNDPFQKFSAGQGAGGVAADTAEQMAQLYKSFMANSLGTTSVVPQQPTTQPASRPQTKSNAQANTGPGVKSGSDSKGSVSAKNAPTGPQGQKAGEAHAVAGGLPQASQMQASSDAKPEAKQEKGSAEANPTGEAAHADAVAGEEGAEMLSSGEAVLSDADGEAIPKDLSKSEVYWLQYRNNPHGQNAAGQGNRASANQQTAHNTSADGGTDPNQSVGEVKTASDLAIEGDPRSMDAKGAATPGTKTTVAQATNEGAKSTRRRDSKLNVKDARTDEAQASAEGVADVGVAGACGVFPEPGTRETFTDPRCVGQVFGSKEDPAETMLRGAGQFCKLNEHGRVKGFVHRAAVDRHNQAQGVQPVAVALQSPTEPKPKSFEEKAAYLERMTGAIPTTKEQSVADEQWFVAHSGRFNFESRKLMEQQGINPDALTQSLNKNQRGNNLNDTVPA